MRKIFLYFPPIYHDCYEYNEIKKKELSELKILQADSYQKIRENIDGKAYTMQCRRFQCFNNEKNKSGFDE